MPSPLFRHGCRDGTVSIEGTRSESFDSEILSAAEEDFREVVRVKVRLNINLLRCYVYQGSIFGKCLFVCHMLVFSLSLFNVIVIHLSSQV